MDRPRLGYLSVNIGKYQSVLKGSWLLFDGNQ